MLRKARKWGNVGNREKSSPERDPCVKLAAGVRRSHCTPFVSLTAPSIPTEGMRLAMTIPFKPAWFRKRNNIYWAPTVCQALQAICVNVLS